MLQYKGYIGHVELDSDARVLHGEVVGIRDVITFQGKSVEQIEAAFHHSVNDYLVFCKKRGEPPEKPPSRRAPFFRNWLACLGTVVLAAILFALCAPADDLPISGNAVPALKPFDDTMIEFMSVRHVPGGSLAVVKDGRLVYVRGYGYADRDKHYPVQSVSHFRIASCSKMITGVAIMTLLEDPKYHLTMETKAFEYLKEKPLLSPGEKIDPRLWQITIRHLLHHRGGWDRDKSGDPMFDHSTDFAVLAHKTPPTDPQTIVRAMMGKPLDFDPGERECYSNFGYCVLGRVIEKASGLSYEQYVKDRVLAPMGITDMYLGHTQLAHRGLNEVHYYQDNDGETASIFPTSPRQVPNPYGAWCLESMDAHGGWVATAVDMAKFITQVDHLLKPQTLEILHERPTLLPGEKPPASYYACGLIATRFTNGGKITYTLWHNGSLPGTFSLLTRRHDGIAWVVLFNQREIDGKKLPDMAIDKDMNHAADSVKDWPAWDLFGKYHTGAKTE